MSKASQKALLAEYEKRLRDKAESDFKLQSYREQNRIEFFDTLPNPGPNPKQAQILEAFKELSIKTLGMSGGNRLGKTTILTIIGISVMLGKFLWDDSRETPEVLTSNCHYPSQKKMIEFEVRPWNTNKEDGTGIGNIFYGSEGYMVVDGYNKYSTFLGKERTPGPTRKEGGDHYKNFIDAVVAKNPSLCNGQVETAHLSSGLAHLGNIAYRVGRVLTFDPKTERFVGDNEADQLLTRTYREPFVVPSQV